MSMQSVKTSRRNWTATRKSKVLAYYAEHGHGATVSHFRISSGQLHNWKKEREGVGGTGPSTGKRNAVRDAIVYLEKAAATAQKENGQSIRARIVYAMIILALARLRGEE